RDASRAWAASIARDGLPGDRRWRSGVEDRGWSWRLSFTRRDGTIGSPSRDGLYRLYGVVKGDGHGRDPGSRSHALSATRWTGRKYGAHPQARHAGPRPPGALPAAGRLAGADATGVRLGRRAGRGEATS